MTQYDNTNRGVLFINDRKEKETQPDRTGSINVDGVEFFLDGWIKDGASGKFLSLSIKRKDKQPNAAAPARAPAPAPRAPAPRRPGEAAHYGAGGAPARPSTGFDDLEDDIPFAVNLCDFAIADSKTRRMNRTNFGG